MSVCVPSDILVPAGRSGAKVQESDLLHAGVHRAAVSMCQPLLPQRQVKARATRGPTREDMALTEGTRRRTAWRTKKNKWTHHTNLNEILSCSKLKTLRPKTSKTWSFRWEEDSLSRWCCSPACDVTLQKSQRTARRRIRSARRHAAEGQTVYVHDIISSFTVSGLSQYRVHFPHLHLKITAATKWGQMLLSVFAEAHFLSDHFLHEAFSFRKCLRVGWHVVDQWRRRDRL